MTAIFDTVRNGLSTATTTATLTASYFQRIKPYTQIDPAKDPRTSFVLVVQPDSDNVKYVLENMSSGKIASIVPKYDWFEYTITNIARNQKFTAQLNGTDDLGYTDGGSEVKYEPETTECTNKECFVGYQWKVETGFWVPGAGNLTLQEKIGNLFLIQLAGRKNMSPTSLRLIINHQVSAFIGFP